LDELNAEGSTAGAAGIKRAYEIGRECFIEGGNNRVILATDGDFNVGESSEGGLVRLIEDKRKSGIYLSILGYGMGNYQDSKMQELSKAGNGNHFYIDNIAEAKKSLIGEFGSTVYTVANDVKFQLEFNPNLVSAYRVVGYENRQLENADFNDDTKDAGELGAGHVVTVIYEIIPIGSTSTFLKNVDPLKYTSKSSPKVSTNEIATVKARYKKDHRTSSVKVEIPVLHEVAESASISESIQWSLIVAEFGLLLRDSPYKSNANFAFLIEKAKKLARDEHRLECVKLIEKANSLSKNSHDTKDSNIE
jgi:Ca-activated chloride channel family protein